jgi:hypothetical protein
MAAVYRNGLRVSRGIDTMNEAATARPWDPINHDLGPETAI